MVQCTNPTRYVWNQFTLNGSDRICLDILCTNFSLWMIIRSVQLSHFQIAIKNDCRVYIFIYIKKTTYMDMIIVYLSCEKRLTHLIIDMFLIGMVKLLVNRLKIAISIVKMNSWATWAPSSLSDKLISWAFPVHQAKFVISWSQPAKTKVSLKSVFTV